MAKDNKSTNGIIAITKRKDLQDIDKKIQWSIIQTAEMFAASNPHTLALLDFKPSKRVRISCKLNDSYLNLPKSLIESKNALEEKPAIQETEESGPMTDKEEISTIDSINTPMTTQVLEEIHDQQKIAQQQANIARTKQSTSSDVVMYQAPQAAFNPSNSIVRRRATQVPTPTWHAPWKLKRVISGHLGWVRSIAVDPTNDWFVTGSADRTIKVWDLASGQLRLTLTGHINCIRGLEVSARHPYLFSAGEDKKVLCWDLEYNKVIRSYHGHLSGVFSLKLHPTLDVLVTGGRDAVARVWDMRSKNQIHCLSGHQGTVWTVETQATDPQVLTGSSDSTVKLWDLAAGKVMTTLTNHKKGIRTIAKSPIDHTFVTGAADNIKKWGAKDGKFLQNFSSHNAIINSLAINQDGVMVSSADNGSMSFWDYKTGYCYQRELTKVQPGSLDSEAGVYASTFDKTGLRFITCEADKTIKVWAEDNTATEESHPIDMKQWTKDFTAPKRY